MSILDMIPMNAYAPLVNLDPHRLGEMVINDIELESEFPDLIITAFSAYEALTFTEKTRLRDELQKYTVADLLMRIGQENELLFSAIEIMIEEKLPIIQYLMTQMERIKILPYAFDQQISEKKR